MQARITQCHTSTAACSSPPEELWQVRPPGGVQHKGTSPLHLCEFIACDRELPGVSPSCADSWQHHLLGYHGAPLRLMLQQS